MISLLAGVVISNLPPWRWVVFYFEVRYAPYALKIHLFKYCSFIYAGEE